MVELAEVAWRYYNEVVQRIIRRRPKAAKYILFGGIAVIVLAGATVGVTLLHRSTEALNNSSAASLKDQNELKPLAKIPAESSGTSSSDTSNGTDARTSSNGSSGNAASGSGPASSGTITPAIPIMKTPADDSGCTMDMSGAVSSYSREVDRRKSKLDSTLSFISLGAINVGLQVSEYNNDVTTLFNEYLNESKQNNCSWPVKTPALLPSDYSR